MSDRPPTSRLSFSEIQAEQERERSASRRNLPSSYSGGGSRSFGRQDSGASYGSRNRGGGGDGSRHHHHHGRGRGPGRYSHYPLEQGRISHIKDSFGFIYCANREDELFYHFSDVTGCHPADLSVDDEVEFRVAPSSNKSDKMAAYELVRLEPGTVQWEVEEDAGDGKEPARFQGIVETMVPKLEMIRRSSSGTYYHDGGGGGSSSTGPPEGSIRILMEREDGDHKQNSDDGDKKGASSSADYNITKKSDDDIVASATGPVVHFMSGEPCALPNVKDTSSSKTKPDSSSVSTKPTKMNVSRLCVNDLVEFRIVTSLRTKKKYARGLVLLQSNKERQRLIREERLLKEATVEQGVVVALKRDFGFLRSNKRREHVYFQYSQVEFPDDDNEVGKEGSEKSEEEGEAATDSGDASNDENEEMLLKEGQDMEFLVVTEEQPGKGARVSARRVQFLPKGAVVFHHVLGEGVTGTIVRCPRLDQPAEMAVGSVKLDQPITSKSDDGETEISVVAFFLADAPGGVHSLDRVGSMRGLWVREGDKLLFDVVRDTVDGSCRIARTKCLGQSSEESEGEEHMIDVKPAVRLIETSFVGRAEGTIASLKEDYGFVTLAERNTDAYFRYEEVFPDSIQESLRQNFPGEPPRRLAVGCEVQFDLSLQGGMPSNKSSRNRKGGNQEKLKATRMLVLPPSSILKQKLLAENVKGIVTREDLQRHHGSLTIEGKVESMAMSERHPFVVQVIEKVKQSGETVVFPNLMGAREDELITRLVKLLGEGQVALSHLPVTAEPNHPGRICVSRVDTKEENPTGAAECESAATENKTQGESSGNTKQEEPPPATVDPLSKQKNNKLKKTPNQGAKLSQTVRFDKNSLAATDAAPPGKGDVVTCSVHQSRKSGALTASNLRVVERATWKQEMSSSNDGIGVVTEVVVARKFGFIHLLDENATKREMLFFDFTSVTGNGPIRKGDEVKFNIVLGGSKGKRTAVNIVVCPKGTLNIPSKAHKDACHGIVLMEPSHTSLSDTPDRKRTGRSRSPKRVDARWEKLDADAEPKKPKSGASIKEEGRILLIKDPTGMFARKQAKTDMPTESSTEKDNSAGAENQPNSSEGGSFKCSHILYKNGAVAISGSGASGGADAGQGPKRGDLVSFVKSKSSRGARDVRVVTKGSATMLRGRLEEIALEGAVGIANFVAETESEEVYPVDLTEVVSCQLKILKNKEPVEGILHDGKIFGICRTADLYLKSKIKSNQKERPKLNLTVRRELGGQIMAQSKMAKGPDGTFGFVSGWTQRSSPFVSLGEEEPEETATPVLQNDE